MAKTVKEAQLETRAKREGLKVSGKPYYRAIGKGLHLGYRKGKRGGVWVMRRKVRQGTHPYEVHKIGRADDAPLDADGVTVLDYWQAHDKAREIARLPTRRSGPYTVADAVEDYLTELEGRASHHDTRRRLEAYALPAFGDVRVDELDSTRLRKWHRDLAKAPRRVRSKNGEQATVAVDLEDDDAARARKVSANRILGQLKAALNHAYAHEKVTKADEWRRVQPFKHVDVSRDRYLTLAESKRLLKAAEKMDADFGVLVRAALVTGARYGHIARLRVGDFDPNGARGKGTLYVRPNSRPGKQRGGYHIVLTEEGKSFFEGLAKGKRKSDWLLGRAWNKSEQLRPMRAAVAKAKIDPPISFNGLRHTYASLSLMGGMSLSAVAKNLGHTDTRMVEKHYGHLADNFVADEVSKHAPRFA
jgi:integrase